MLIWKVLLGLGILGGATAFAFSGTAHAKALPPALPKDLQNKMEKALASGDPIMMRRLAEQVEKAGFPEQAETLRKAADEVAAAMKSVPDLPPVRSPDEQPKRGADVFRGGEAGTVTKTPEKLTYVVKEGDSMARVARKLTGNERRWAELLEPNKHLKTSKKSYGTIIDPFYAGMVINLPESWRDALQGDEVSGDRSPRIDEQGARRLAGRVALEVARKKKGAENRELIATFQKLERQRGMMGVPATGVFDHVTAVALARNYGIVPPLKFADGKDIYWPTNPAPAKNKLREIFTHMARRDPSRTEEWTQAAQSIG